MLYGSDVIYKTFVTPDIAKALNGAGIPIGGTEGASRSTPGQILPDLGWLNSIFIAEKIGAQAPPARPTPPTTPARAPTGTSSTT